ncbi:MAG: HEAT repeat domain-containing protein [Deltaproteobacteria bacterium]|nr:HEAT repeat domain-containing protein [Deltaproteobacteria bacterium]
MGSRLSSLLVQNELVGVDEMQDAFTRQVVRGGALDTILLERKHVTEGVLLTLLSRSLGMPHIPPKARENLSPALADALPLEQAEKLGICAIAISHERLRVVVGDESDSSGLDELAQELGTTIECFAATELRIIQLRCELYGEKLPRRFERLLKKLGAELPEAVELENDDDYHPQASQPHLRSAAIAWATAERKDALANKITEEEEPVEEEPVEEEPVEEEPVEEEPVEEEPAVEEPALANIPTEIDPAPPQVIVDDPERLLNQDTIEAPSSSVDPANVRHARPRRLTDANPEIVDDQPMSGGDSALRLEAQSGMLEAIDPALHAHATHEPPASTQPQKRAEPGFIEPTPLDLDEALIAMHTGSSRDDVLLSLLRGCYKYVSAIDLFVRQGRKLVGRFALRDRILDGTEVRQRFIPLDFPSVVSRAAGDGAIYIGPSPDTDASATVLLDADILAPHLAIIPVMLRERTVCLLIGHQQDAPIPGGVRGPLDRLASEAAKALAQVIVRRKKSLEAAANKLEPKPMEVSPPTESQPWGMAPLDASGEIDASLARDHCPAGREDKVIITLDVEVANRTAEDLVDSLNKGDGDATEILNELRRRGRLGIDAVLELFPGELRFQRTQTAELPLVSECSTVLRVLMHLGRPVIPCLAPLLIHGDDDVRFYATYLLSELIFPESVVLLAGRLQDNDGAVRRAATYGLRRCRELPQFADILQDLREDLTHPDSRPRRAAMEALAALGDVVATPSLIAQLKDAREDVMSSAHRSLVTLTKQNFAQDPAQWRRWWERNRQRHRVEWLIDGLVHNNYDIRESAAMELRELTGMAFGYSPDLDADARGEIRRKYVIWWSERGINGQS